MAYFRRHRAIASHAEDLLQDTFVRAVRGWARLRDSASPRAYLFGIARNVCRDALRYRRPEVEMKEEPAAAAEEEDVRLERLRAAIGRLPALHHETLLLKLQQELSYEEIAEVLDVPVGTVRSRLHHAVARLREALEAPGGG